MAIFKGMKQIVSEASGSDNILKSLVAQN